MAEEQAPVVEPIRRNEIATRIGLPRRLALLGGTTTAGDIRVAIGYLASPHRSVQGPSIAEYEREFARRIGVQHAFSFASGRVGLYGLLKALGIGRGDELLLQVPTHIVVANAIRYTGARPIYVDCRLEDYNIDLEQAEQRATSQTKALLLQHTFGIPVDLEAALALARRLDLIVIEDCVHSLGARYQGRAVGGFGLAAFFSTEETKTISSTMGGMVVTDDARLADCMRAFQATCSWPSRRLVIGLLAKLVLHYYLTQPYLHPYPRKLYELTGRRNPLPPATSEEEQLGRRPVQYEQRLSNAQAALALRQLHRLERNVAHRQTIGNAFAAQLAKSDCRLPVPPAGAEPSYVRYPVWVEDREAAIRRLSSRIVVGTWFSSVLEEAGSPAHGGYEMGSCPRAESVANHVINLPTHLRVSLPDVAAITSALAGSTVASRTGETREPIGPRRGMR